jgi:hypothetical protein
MVLMTNWKKFTAEKKINIFGSKIAIYLFLDVHKGLEASLQPSKEYIQHLKT